MATNPVDVGIPRDQADIVSCMSNAAYYQKVTIQWPSGGDTVIFKGTGEDVQMKTPEIDSKVSYTTPSSRNRYARR